MSRIRTILQVQTALKVWLQQLDGLNYTTIFPADHFYDASMPALNTENDADYPKIILPIDAGKETDTAGKSSEESLSFDAIFVFKQIPNAAHAPWTLPVQQQVITFIDELKALRRSDDTLNGAIDAMPTLEWTTDSGFAAPEGFVWAKLQMKWRNYH